MSTAYQVWRSLATHEGVSVHMQVMATSVACGEVYTFFCMQRHSAAPVSIFAIVTTMTDACRVLWSGLLSQLASFPPVTVQQILDAIQDRMLSLGSDVPASLRAQPFSDTALAQVTLALMAPRLLQSKI